MGTFCCISLPKNNILWPLEDPRAEVGYGHPPGNEHGDLLLENHYSIFLNRRYMDSNGCFFPLVLRGVLNMDEHD